MRCITLSSRLSLGIAGLALAVSGTAAVAAPEAQSLIVGGRPASNGEYPWAAALYNANPSSGQFCGGTLVEPTYVVTAAHCSVLIVPGATRVLLGRNTLSGSGGESLIVVANEVHPLYNAVTNENDVAVLRLATASTQRPLPYAHPGQESLWKPGVKATVVGWGATEEGGEGSDALLEAVVPVVSDSDCQAAYGAFINPRLHLCAGYMNRGGVDTCQGDSGGPLMVPTGGSFLLAGITSFGDGCARPGKPGVYTEVAGVANFIDLVTP